MSDDNDLLLPESSPTKLTKRVGVRRVNNVPLYLIWVVVGLFLLIIGTIFIKKAEKSQVATENGVQEKQGDAVQFAEVIAGDHKDGVVPAELPPLPSAIPIALPDDMDMPPLPDRLQQNKLQPVSASSPDMERIRQQKMQLFENAVKSKTSVPISERVTQSTYSNRNLQGALMLDQNNQASQGADLNSSFQAKLAELQAGDKNSGPMAVGGGNDIKQFAANGKGNRWQLDSQMEASPTPYTLRAGFVIPATLISGINSELPGQIIGQVSQNVYDTASGKYLLIPQGSRLVGSYASDIAYGQSRVLVAWQRIVFPDGRAMDIGAMPGADGIGNAGLTDQVNNHYLRIFGSALLMSGITAGVSLSQDRDSNSIYSQPTTSSILSEALGQQLGNTTAQMINKNLNISPTLEIRPGFRFNVMCVKDLVFNQPYALFDN